MAEWLALPTDRARTSLAVGVRRPSGHAGVMLMAGLLTAGCRHGSAAWPLSPFDHGGSELDASASPLVRPNDSPIIHQAHYKGERELFGHRPRFMPTSAVAFDPENRPLIRAARPDTETGDGSEDGFLQTVDRRGRWRAYPVTRAFRRAYPGWSGTYATGVRAYDTRVVCDRGGDVYTVFRLSTPQPRRVLIHLPRGAADGSLLQLPFGGRLESADRCLDRSLPPMLVGHHEGRLAFCEFRRLAAGGLEATAPVPFSPEGCGLNPAHSGAGPVAARVGGRSYFVYAANTPVPNKGERINGVPFDGKALREATDGPNHPGTAQYVTWYDHDTGTLGEPVLLGFGQNCYTPKPDVHNGPAIVADSDGGLHAVLGAHQHHFWYVRSKVREPQTRADWTEPVALGHRRRYDCGLTYVALAIDRRDTLHLVGRNLSRGHDSRGKPLPAGEMNAQSMMRTLDYFRARRQPDGTWRWEEKGALVMPLWHLAYSIFYHKLSIDRRDRLFLTYYYYADQLSEEAATAYRQTWPEEKQGADKTRPRAHDPVILMSDDGGDTWRIALTDDFVSGALR